MTTPTSAPSPAASPSLSATFVVTGEPKPGSKPERLLPQAPVTVERSVTIAGQVVRYRATAGVLPIRDEAGKIKAEVFYTAYERLGVEERSARPITFAFNGGPGSSSVWLHLGTMGPRRVVLGPEGEAPPPPGGLVDNPWSWLDVTDLVFIDPVSTGFSRAAEGEDPKQFHGLDEDIKAVGEFIRLYTSREGRWLSPKFLAGESYGTTRAAGLADTLQRSLGMYLNGLILISPALGFQTLDFAPGQDLPHWLYVPGYAATAWFHRRLSAERQALPVDAVVREAEVWSREVFQVALSRGAALTGEGRAAVARDLAGWLGVSVGYVERWDLRVPLDSFMEELLREQGRVVGRLDSRYTAAAKGIGKVWDDGDPSYAVIQGPFTAGLNHYVRDELGYRSDLPYEILSPKVWPWKYAENQYASTMGHLRRGMTANPRLRVLVCMGWFDLATPPSAGDFTLDHLGLDAGLRGNIERAYYASGHMMYVRQQDLEKIRADVLRFIGRSLPGT